MVCVTEIRFNHVSVLQAISFIFQIGNVIGVFHNNPFQLLGDTIARLLRRHFILIRMSDGFWKGLCVIPQVELGRVGMGLS